jgi:cation transporter-like permease
MSTAIKFLAMWTMVSVASGLILGPFFEALLRAAVLLTIPPGNDRRPGRAGGWLLRRLWTNRMSGTQTTRAAAPHHLASRPRVQRK